MLGKKWITDRTPSQRYAHYTRANAGEVLADPVTPLGWTWAWESGVVLGCRDGFISYGVLDADEYGDPPESFGSFGGYFYNSLTQARMMGVRTPGATPEAIDAAYFDDHPDVPPYVEEDWHESAEHSAKLEKTGAYLISATNHPPIEEQKVLAKELRDGRPDLGSLSNEELVARARSMQPRIIAMFEQHVWASLGAATGAGILGAVCGELGRPQDTVRLLTGIGEVDSADISRELWKLSRLIRSSTALTAAFDAGIDDSLLDRVDDEFRAGLDAFIYEHGSRGPNEWDPGSDSYETKPDLALRQLDVVRKQGDEADPVAALATNSAERKRLAAEIAALLAENDEAAAMFGAGMQASQIWMAARERCKGNNIRVIGEMRVCFDELGRRMTEAGHIDNPKQIYMLLEDEVDTFVVDPGSFSTTLSERNDDFAELLDLVPPFIVSVECPPISEWDRRSDVSVEVASSGDVLEGVACSPGTVTGPARLVLSAGDPGALQPGDILVAPSTDPAWTPLFLAAGGVVVNVGAVASHASIVSRELGIPCVASVADATMRIPDGASITIDGAAGTVTIN